MIFLHTSSEHAIFSYLLVIYTDKIFKLRITEMSIKWLTIYNLTFWNWFYWVVMLTSNCLYQSKIVNSTCSHFTWCKWSSFATRNHCIWYAKHAQILNDKFNTVFVATVEADIFTWARKFLKKITFFKNKEEWNTSTFFWSKN